MHGTHAYNTNHLMKKDSAFLIGIKTVLGCWPNRIRILFNPIGPHKFIFQTFSRWSLNVKQKQPGYLSHQQISQTVFVPFRILFDLVFIHFDNWNFFWYQVSYYSLFVGSLGTSVVIQRLLIDLDGEYTLHSISNPKDTKFLKWF
jgi:hypothetical protein